MIKKDSVLALFLLLTIPVALATGGFLFSLIDPEMAARQPNYAQNFHRLMVLKVSLWLGGVGIAVLLWFLVCMLVLRSKQRSYWWLVLALVGPFGLAVLAMLTDEAPAETDSHARFVGSLSRWLRAGYAICVFATILVLAYEAMVFNRVAMVRVQAAMTGISVAQIIDQQNTSGGMWAFAEGNEVMFLMALFYLLWPLAFNMMSRAGMMRRASRAR